MESRSQLLFTTVLSTALIAGAISCTQPQGAGGAPTGKGGGKKGGDVPVVVAKSIHKDVPIDLDVIGNVEASVTVSIKPQIGGELRSAQFREGDFVAKGDPMFEIDRRTITAQIDQATANLARSEAMLRQAQANLAKDMSQAEYLRSQASRTDELVKQGIVSKEAGQQATSQAQAQKELTDADRAAIESARADIAANRATVENLKVQLGFTTIRAPISGRTGTLLVKPGNIVSANTTELVTINQIQPVNVTFAVPESQFQKIASRFGKEKISVVAAPPDEGQPDPTGHGGIGGPHTGTLIFIENTVDPATGTIRLRASFPNEDRKMWPGQFVRVRMRLGVVDQAVVVPNQAVQSGQDGTFIYVVGANNVVESRPVTVGLRSGTEMVISKGLNAGETVIIDGALRLAPGMRVSPRPPGGGRGPGGGKGGDKSPTAAAPSEANAPPATAEPGAGASGSGGGGEGKGRRGGGKKKSE
jgi:multidrug efflux system membrane fusion protein